MVLFQGRLLVVVPLASHCNHTTCNGAVPAGTLTGSTHCNHLTVTIQPVMVLFQRGLLVVVPLASHCNHTTCNGAVPAGTLSGSATGISL